MQKLKIKRTNQDAIIPTRATQGSAGYDLYSCNREIVKIFPGQTEIINTGIAIELPNNNYVAYIFARSSLGIKKGVIPANCVAVIDSDYRGEILVGLYNYSDEIFSVNYGDRIAQMSICPVFTPELVEVDELDPTQRNSGRFGSTGK